MRSKVLLILNFGHFTLLAIGVIFSLSGCDSLKKKYFYSFEFAAEVEGELFSLETKVTCEPVTTGRMGIFKRSTFYYAQMAAYGHKLKSGRGFFVSTPDMCPYLERGSGSREWAFTGTKSIIPVMFFTDAYSKSNHATVLVDPNGPAPETGVKIISATVKPLTGSDIDTVEKLPPDKNNPFMGFEKRNWFGFVLFPLQNGPLLENGEILLSSKDNRLQVYRFGPEEIRMISNKLDRRPWTYLERGVPVDDLFLQQGEEENLRKATVNSQEVTVWGWENLLSLKLDGSSLEFDSSIKGAINFYEPSLLAKYLAAPGEKGIRINLEGVEGKIGETHRDITFLLLFDRENGQKYIAQRVSFGLVYRR